MSFPRTPTLLLLLPLLLAAGCFNSNQSSLGTVSGTVLVDGKPASGVRLEFDPLEKGVRGSTAVTNSSGNYEAIYSLSRDGVRLGPCIVKLEAPLTMPGDKSKLPYPEEYYEEIRQVEITSGHNTVDLEISKSKS